MVNMYLNAMAMSNYCSDTAVMNEILIYIYILTAAVMVTIYIYIYLLCIKILW
jgi:hypothetical protein